MASQLLPLGMCYTPHILNLDANPTNLELIDKCVGSRIWVVMKGDKGIYPISYVHGDM